MNEIQGGSRNKTDITAKLRLLEQRCLNCGLRWTQTRRVILAIMLERGGYLSTQDIYTAILKRGIQKSLATVYRVLSRLAEEGIVEQHYFEGAGMARFQVARGTPRDHLIDVDSGQVIEFQDDALEQLKTRIAEEYGYPLARCRVKLYVDKPASNSPDDERGNHPGKCHGGGQRCQAGRLYRG